MLLTLIYVCLYFYCIDCNTKIKLEGIETPPHNSLEWNHVSEEQDTEISPKLKICEYVKHVQCYLTLKRKDQSGISKLIFCLTILLIRRHIFSVNRKSTIETSLSKHQGNIAVEEPLSVLNAHHYPFVASIQRLGSHYATGTLVDKRWVLTCASEFYK